MKKRTWNYKTLIKKKNNSILSTYKFKNKKMKYQKNFSNQKKQQKKKMNKWII